MVIRFIRAGDWSVGQVSIRWTANTRGIVPEVEAAIDKAWTAAANRPGVHLFDGPMCRLESWQATDAHLELALSRSSYRIFLGTNMSHPEFADTIGSSVMANPVGLSAPLLTLDHRLLLGRRSAAVAYYPSRVHPFAGSLEPDDADVFTAISRELKEELAIDPSDLTDLRCIGIAEDQSLHQPELIFAAESSMTAAQIEARLDRSEHTAIWSIPATGQDVGAAITDHQLTPIAIASLLLWGRRKFGAGWCDSAGGNLFHDASGVS